MEIKNNIAFRVTRNHDYDLHEDEVLDLLKSVEAEIRDRSDKIAVRLEIEPGAPKKVVNLLARQLGVEDRFIYEINGPINTRDFLSLYEIPVDASHKDPPFNPRIRQRFAADKDIFTVIREGDVLLFPALALQAVHSQTCCSARHEIIHLKPNSLLEITSL